METKGRKAMGLRWTMTARLPEEKNEQRDKNNDENDIGDCHNWCLVFNVELSVRQGSYYEWFSNIKIG